MKGSRALLCAAAIVCGGCFHVTVITGAPASAQTIDKEWQLSFVAGLVPPPELSTKEACPQGVAKVETEQSFMNVLVRAVSQSIVTPMHVTVTCASGPVAR